MDELPFVLNGRGRPKKSVPGWNIKTVTYKDLGRTRRQVFEWMRLAEVPDDEFEAMLALLPKEMMRAGLSPVNGAAVPPTTTRTSGCRASCLIS